MKTSFRTSILLIFLSLLISCEKFLDVQPKDAVSDEFTIVDKPSAETAVRGMYRALSANGYYGSTFQSNGYLQGGDLDWTDTRQVSLQFINHDVRADNSEVSAAWAAIYNTVNRANHIIEKVPLVTDSRLTQSLRDQLLGEAYFVRALCFFDLARTWGGVQIPLTPTKDIKEKLGTPRSSLEETYAQVLKDLNAAETLLPATTNRVRATKKTVWALKARFYLYQKRWEEAESFATNLISDNAYRLVAPYSAFFAGNVTNTQESVLETSYSANFTNGHRNQWQPSSNGGTRRWAPTDELVQILTTPATGGGRSELVKKTTQGQWYGNLYYRSPATDPAYIIRIAELYLIRAEARAQQGNVESGVADLNAVRNRAGLTPANISDREELLLAIEDERRLEFVFEPHRWYDLVRTNRAGAVLGVNDPNKYVLPIPIQEIETDPGLVQNPGY